MKTDFVTARLLHQDSKLQAVCGTLAKLHAIGAPDDLLTQMGVDFLKNLFYPGLLGSSNAVVLTVMDEETVAAFVAAAVDMQRCLREIVMSRPLRSVWYGFSSVLVQPRLWRGFLEATQVSAPEHAQPAAEILMVTTAINYRGRGLGRRLLLTLDEDLRRRGVRACIARVREDNTHAMRMYENSGYRDIGAVTFNGSQWRWLAHEVPEKGPYIKTVL